MKVSAAKKDLKDMLGEGVRDTIHQTLGAVIHRPDSSLSDQPFLFIIHT